MKGNEKTDNGGGNWGKKKKKQCSIWQKIDIEVAFKSIKVLVAREARNR